MYYEDILDIDLDKANQLHRSFLLRSIGEGDINANRFGVRLFRGDEAVSLAGASCMGYFIRPDDITLIIDGTISGNAAYVELPAAAFAKAGAFSLAVKVIESGKTTTVRIVDGAVADTTSGDVSDPTGSIPDIDELLAVIGRAEAAADTVDNLHITAAKIEGTRYRIEIVKDE